MRCEKFGCKRNWSWLGFGLAKFGGLAFFALVAQLVNKWGYRLCAIVVVNCHKCIKNEVWKVCLQKELILVGFWLSQVRWIDIFWLGSKIGEKVMLWFLCNLSGELSQMQKKMRCEKFGCKRNWSWLGFGLAKFGGLAFFAFVAKLLKK